MDKTYLIKESDLYSILNEILGQHWGLYPFNHRDEIQKELEKRLVRYEDTGEKKDK